MCSDKFDDIYDAFDYLVETIVKNDPSLAQVKKENKQLKRELAKTKFELNKRTTMFQAKKSVVDSFDVFSTKSLDMVIDNSKDAFAGLESNHSKVASDSNVMLGMIDARDLENQKLASKYHYPQSSKWNA